jgi:hypothetical protein
MYENKYIISLYLRIFLHLINYLADYFVQTFH